MVLGEPRRSNSRVSMTRSSLVCVSRGRSPISSRKMVDPFARSNRPVCLVRAPVYAPFSRPKSSDSISVPGIAAQFTFTIGRGSARAQLMNGRGDALLARARFTEQQHRRSGRRHLADQIKGAPEGGTRPHDLRGVAPLSDFVAQVHVVVLQLVPEPLEVVERGLELSSPSAPWRAPSRRPAPRVQTAPQVPRATAGLYGSWRTRGNPKTAPWALSGTVTVERVPKRRNRREVGGGFRGQVVEGRNRDGFARQNAPGHPGEVVRRRGVLRNRIACREELAGRSAHDTAVDRH